MWAEAARVAKVSMETVGCMAAAAMVLAALAEAVVAAEARTLPHSRPRCSTSQFA